MAQDVVSRQAEALMRTRKISLGEMWRSEASGKIYIVTSFCKEVLSSYACLRCVEPSEGSRKARLVKTDSGETLMGFYMAQTVNDLPAES